MKKMAGLQLSVVTDPRSKQAIEKQIAQWDENLEKLQIEQYRLRCYMASLQGSELPNPKVSRGHRPIRFVCSENNPPATISETVNKSINAPVHVDMIMG